MSILRLVNVKISGYGDHLWNVVSLGLRFRANRAEFRRMVRLKTILKEHPSGIGIYTRAQIEDAITKTILQ